jgi:small-conductance mechanosensitive channel
MPGSKTPSLPHAKTASQAVSHASGSVSHATTAFSDRVNALASQFGHWVTGNIVGIAIAAAAGTAIAVAMIGVRSLGCRLLGRMDAHTSWGAIFARVLAKTKIYFIVLASAQLVANHAATPPAVLGLIHALFVIAAAIQAAIWARELILGFIEHRMGADEGHTTLGSAIGIIRLLVTVTLFAVAMIVILDNLEVNVTGLVAGLGVGGIAIGLAAQGIFSDLFAALSILFDRPFRRGDSIRFGDVAGTVEQIGLKTTRVRSITGEQIVVANGKLLEQQIHNFALLEYRRVVLVLGLVRQTPPEKCRSLADILKKIVEAHRNTRMVRCGMTALGASTLDFELQFDVHSIDFEEVYATKSAICIDLIEALETAGIQLAYPSTTTFMAAPDGRLIMPYPAPAPEPPETQPQPQE